MADNLKALEKMRILSSILAGVISGILNLNQLQGPTLYFSFHLLMTFLVALSTESVEKVFIKKSDVFTGIGGGLLIFVCAWMIVFNIVYVL